MKRLKKRKKKLRSKGRGEYASLEGRVKTKKTADDYRLRSFLCLGGAEFRSLRWQNSEIGVVITTVKNDSPPLWL